MVPAVHIHRCETLFQTKLSNEKDLFSDVEEMIMQNSQVHTHFCKKEMSSYQTQNNAQKNTYSHNMNDDNLRLMNMKKCSDKTEFWHKDKCSLIK